MLSQKIFKVLMLRASDELFETYYISWQKNYNLFKNKLKIQIMFEFSNVGNYLEKRACTQEIQMELIVNNPEDVYAKYAADVSEKTNMDFKTVLTDIYKIKTTSVLGMNVLKNLYLFCSAEHLLKNDDSMLCNIVNMYSREQKEKFFINFVKKVTPDNYKKYLKLAKMAKYVINTENNAFKLYSVDIQIKLRMWFSLLEIDTIFGEDERGIFWKAKAIQYGAENIIKKDNFSLVIMYLKNFVALEFINRNDGPVYIFSIKKFESNVKKIVYSSYFNKQEIKSVLYNNYKNTSNRIVHKHDWRTNIINMIEWISE